MGDSAFFGGSELRLNPRSTPRCVVDFYTQAGSYRASATLAPNTPMPLAAWLDADDFEQTPSPGLIQCTTNKDIAAAAGSWSLVLHDRPIPHALYHNPPSGNTDRWNDLLDQDDLVVIRMGRGPGLLKTVMVGMLSQRPERSKVVTPEGIVRTVTVQGQDLGRMLLNTKNWYFTDLPAANLQASIQGGFLTLGKDLQSAYSLHRAIRMQNVIEQVFYANTKASFPNYGFSGAGVRDLLGYWLGLADIQIFPSPDQYFFDLQGPIWGILKSLAEEPWYELFVDTVPLTAQMRSAYHPQGIETSFDPRKNDQDTTGNVIIMRQTPFAPNDWNNLPIYRFGEDMVTGMGVGGSPELYNFFFARADDPAINAISSASDYTKAFEKDDASIAAHGLHILERKFSGMFIDDGQKKIAMDGPNIAKELSGRLKTYFQNIHLYDSGSFTIQGTPDPRVGCRAQYEDSDRRMWEYYNETVTQSFSALGKWDTRLQVTRGREIRNRYGKAPKRAIA